MSSVKVEVVGNIGFIDELRHVGEKQSAVLNFSVAVPVRRRNANGQWENLKDIEGKDVVNWKYCEVWNTSAENVAKSLTKGTRVIVTGKEDMDRGYKKDDGTIVPPRVRIKVDTVAVDMMFNSVTVHDNRNGGGGSNNSNNSAPAASNPAPAAQETQDPLASLDYGGDGEKPTPF